MDFSLSSLAPKNLVSRDAFGSPVPRPPAHLHTQAKSGAYLLRDSYRFPWRCPFVYLNHNCVPMAFILESPPAQGK